MRRLLSCLLSALLVLSLCACGKPARNADNYYVDETTDGWCILYQDEKGEAEEIAIMGSYRQPLVLEKGRFFFTRPGALVSVNADGEDLQSWLIPDLPDGSFIAYRDEEAVYCVAEETAAVCWRVDLAQQQAEQITIPRKFRQIDYAALLAQILTDSGAVDQRARISKARAELDSNGSLLQLGLEMLVYTGDVGSMHVWNHVGVAVTVTTQGPQLTITDHHFPLSLAEDTTQQEPTLQEFFTALESADTSEAALKHADGTADGFFLLYADEDFTYNAADAPTYTMNGEPTQRSEAALQFVLAQVGGTQTTMTDHKGTPCGNLLVLQADAA